MFIDTLNRLFIHDPEVIPPEVPVIKPTKPLTPIPETPPIKPQ